MHVKLLWSGAYGISSLSEKTKKFNRLQMSFHRQQFLLSNLKTLRWWPPGWQTGAYPIKLIGRRLIVKVNERTREFKNSFSVRIRFLPCKAISSTLEWLPSQQDSETKGNCPRRDFAQKAKSRGGTLVTRAYIKESTYSWNIQSYSQYRKKSRFTWTGAARNR